MAQPFTLVACKIFKDELEAVLPGGFESEIIWIDEGLHADPALLEKKLGGACEQAKKNGCTVRFLFGSACLPDLCDLARKEGAEVPCFHDCIAALCGESRKELEQGGTMLMTPAWVRGWPRMMQRLGWDETDTRMNFGRYDRILVLDAGLNSLTDEEVLNFFDLVQIPLEFQSLDLARFRESIQALLGIAL